MAEEQGNGEKWTLSSDAGKALSKLGAAKGGQARAKSLTPEARSEIARRAVEARWSKHGKKPVPRVMLDGELRIGDLVIECAVLDGGIRVLSERAFSRAIGAKRGGSHWIRMKADPGGAKLPVFLSANNLKPFISDDLAAALSSPVHYIAKGGQVAYGIEASRIPEILDVWLKARNAQALTIAQVHFAEKAEILVRGLAHVGIIALVDEATGFQDARTRDALARILEAFVAKGLRKWVQTFSLDYFRQLCRLKNVPFLPNMKLPRYFGKLTNDIVYSRLAPGVLATLREKNPVTATGRRKNKHFQWLTQDIGNPKLAEHLSAVVALMRIADDWDSFYASLDKAGLHVWTKLPLFDEIDGILPPTEGNPEAEPTSVPVGP